MNHLHINTGIYRRLVTTREGRRKVSSKRGTCITTHDVSQQAFVAVDLGNWIKFKQKKESEVEVITQSLQSRFLLIAEDVERGSVPK